MLWDFTVEYSTDDWVTPVEIGNVQSIDVRAGRQAQIDNFSSAGLTVTCRYPNGFASPITALKPGVAIRVTALTTTGGYPFDAFYGYITDISVQYGIPYAGSVGPADYLHITAETALAQLARSSGNGYSMAAGAVTTQVATATTQSGVGVGAHTFSYYSTRNASAATISGSWADWLNTMAFTFGGRIIDAADVYLIGFQPLQDYSTNPSLYLSDTGTGVPYDVANFDSLAQNYFTQVTVDPDAYAAQTVNTGSAPYRNFSVNTWSSSTTEATDLANWYLNNYKNPSLAVSELHLNLNDSRTNVGVYNLFNAAGSVLSLPGAFPIGVQIKVLFRGQSYVCMIEGGSLSASPDRASLTLYVSGADLNAYLVLDNQTFGRLDYNKLGF